MDDDIEPEEAITCSDFKQKARAWQENIKSDAATGLKESLWTKSMIEENSRDRNGSVCFL